MRPPSQFGDDITNQMDNNEMDPRMGAMMICTRLAGRAIIRVVSRCNEAQENNNLDLSECQLMQVPDAVYHLMRHTELKSCDLSGNEIAKLPPKFAIKFSLINELNLSHNQMSKLPDEIADLASLQRLDLSHNAFISLPNAVYRIPQLQILNASNNHIVDVEVERLEEAPSLEEVNLSNNPIMPRCHDMLSAVTTFRVTISAREKEDWEDLTI